MSPPDTLLGLRMTAENETGEGQDRQRKPSERVTGAMNERKWGEGMEGSSHPSKEMSEPPHQFYSGT